MPEINMLEFYPRSKRPIDDRARLVTSEHRAIARQFDREYFDGDRLSGYGGYHYHPRFFSETVRYMARHYGLGPGSSILDVGCAKGFMLHDFQQLDPEFQLYGVDVSAYALENAVPAIRSRLQLGNATHLPFEDASMDLVISINTIHNLNLEDCKQALREIQRVSRRHAFVVVDAWRNEEEKKRMLDWNLTALTYMSVPDWEQLFLEVGYTHDYYWFIAE